jgi:DNA-binding beta-propeller fold protein YncE
MLKRIALFMACCVFVVGASLAARSGTQGEDSPQYKPAPHWPELPKGFQFGQVAAVATDKDDNVFVFHRGKQPIAVFDKAGKFLRSWGDDEVKNAHGLRIDPDGNVWTTDIGTHLVIKYNPKGKVLLTLGQKNKPGDSPEQFNKPTDVAVTPAGVIYISDGYGNSRVVKYSREGKFVKEWGKKGKEPGEFNLPHAVVLDAEGRVYVGDRENNRIQVFDGDGKFLAQWRDSGAPFGMFLARGPRMLIADGRADEVRRLDKSGKLLSRFGKKGTEAGEFLLPHGICADSQGAIYVAEIEGKRLQKFVAQ